MACELKEEDPVVIPKIDRQAILAELAAGKITAEEATRRLAGE